MILKQIYFPLTNRLSKKIILIFNENVIGKTIKNDMRGVPNS